MSRRRSRTATAAIGVGVLVGIVLLLSGQEARGQTTTIPTTSIPPGPSLTTSATPSAFLGESITDSAFLSGGFNPTGRITFDAYGPGDPSCSGSPIFTSNVDVNGSGDYTSNPFTPADPGTYQWVAAYTGDANNAPATSPCGASFEQSVVTVGPMIEVDKFVVPESLPAPGGDFQFFVVVDNTGSQSVDIAAITDDLYDVTTGTCDSAVGTGIAPGGSYFCSFTGTFMGPAGSQQTDTVFVEATTGPDGIVVSDTGQATAFITPPLGLAVTKTPTPESLPEPGGDVTYTVVVTNTSEAGADTLTIRELFDDVYGDVATPGSDCDTIVDQIGPSLAQGGSAFGAPFPLAVAAVGSPFLAPGESASCTFTAPFTGNAGDSLTDVVTAVAENDNGFQVTATDDATVTLTPVAPTITVEKTATPLSLPDPGGEFTYTVTVTNTSEFESVTVTSLVDNVYGDLASRPGSTCQTVGTLDLLLGATPAAAFGLAEVAVGAVVDSTLGPGESASCTFTGTFTGPGGSTLTDVVTAVAVDDDGQTATDGDDATVTITGGEPAVTVTKTPTPASRPEPGGDFTYNVVVTNTSAAETVTITSLTDNVYGDLPTRPGATCGPLIGTVLAPGASISCAFTAPFTGSAGSLTDVVRVAVEDDDGQTVAATASATVTLTDVAPSVSVQKRPSPPTRPAPGGTFQFLVSVTNTSSEPATVVSLVDDVYGDLTTLATSTCTAGSVLPPGGGYLCAFEVSFTGVAGASETDTVTVRVEDDDGSPATASGSATVSLGPAPVTITVMATPTAEVGEPITATAALANGASPTGTITFSVFGPDDPTCSGAAAFTATVPVNGNGSFTSAPFVPTAAGTYRWVASYSGDPSNPPVATACGAPGSVSTVTAPPPPPPPTTTTTTTTPLPPPTTGPPPTAPPVPPPTESPPAAAPTTPAPPTPTAVSTPPGTSAPGTTAPSMPTETTVPALPPTTVVTPTSQPVPPPTTRPGPRPEEPPDRSAFVESVTDPTEVSFNPTLVVQNILLAALLILLIAFPAELFNATLLAHYEEIQEWPLLRRLRGVRAALGALPAGAVLGGFAVVASVAYSLLSPDFGWNRASLVLVLGMLVALLVVSVVYDVVRASYMRRRFGYPSRLRGQAIGLAVGLLLVLASRLADFLPGYLYGVFTALAFARTPSDREDGQGLAFSSVLLGLLALVAWFLWVPVKEAATEPGAGLAILVLDASLACLWVAGLGAIVFGLAPIRFFYGEQVKKWSRTGWWLIYVVGMLLFVHTLLHPVRGFYGKTDDANLAKVLALFISFAVLSVLFWGYYRYRHLWRRSRSLAP